MTEVDFANERALAELRDGRNAGPPTSTLGKAAVCPRIWRRASTSQPNRAVNANTSLERDTGFETRDVQLGNLRSSSTA